ncbi:Water stress and Hypersensitive response domain protein [Halorubrum saccharovorum DSM 1137]|uniref:Water stress and Hypersensitive response domain protein n=1 Tax=Halorubrum saccharovorum DSM 1137 TaxID=1227484 RepID=M0DLC7_9EURY|nr:LEA type 2 family protein [Halorubrum saccharovorum]ELZ36311.1 Water stress and Hypersensitive response domain protein [Halorubrum saccharovorum DSM 1137]
MNPSDVLSALVSSKLRIALVGVLVVVGAVGGAFVLGILGVPSVAAVDNTFGDVTNETTEIETDLVVSNPNPVGIGLDGVSVNYTVSMNGIEMAQGGREGVSVGTGNSTLELETRLRNDGIPPWWVSHVRNGERTTLDIDATATSDRLGRGVDFSRSREIQTDLLGAFNSDETRPVNADSPFVSDPVLYVNETRGEWGTVSESETPIEMAFTVYNPNFEPYAVTEIGYDITMNGVAMGSGQTDEGYVIPSESTETVEFTTALQNRHLDDWWVTHLDEDVRGHQVTDLRIEFYAVIEFPTGEETTIPLDALTYEERIETDIFGEGDDVRNGTDSSGNGSDSDAGNETDGDSSDGDATDDGNQADDSDGGTTDGTDDGSDDGTENGTDDGSGDDDDGVLPV